jgi:hypothetical protein
MATSRKASKGGTKRKAKAVKYVVKATFKMTSEPIPKSAADNLAKKARSQGGTVTIKKA